jgi:hypothetical protein
MQQYSVAYSETALVSLERFIEYLQIKGEERFSDTGLHGVDTILDMYHEAHSSLREGILCEFERLGKLSAIGTIYGETGNIRKTRLIFPIRSYSVTAWCLADTQAGVLTVESISIHT